MMRLRRCLLVIAACCTWDATAQGTPQPAEGARPAAAAAAAPLETPEWLYPVDPVLARAARAPQPKNPPKLDDQAPLGVPGSDVTFTRARIDDPFDPPDWRPSAHGPAPAIVAKGRKPNVWACAFCHSHTGQGRPENAALAGLPEAYLRQQLRDFRSGARKPLGPEAYQPSLGMHKAAKGLTDQEIDDSARYFSQQKLLRRVWVIEGLNMPRLEPVAWVYKEIGGMDSIEDRLLEATPDIERHERRDDRLEYNAYVPPGAIAAGKLLVTRGGSGKTQPCAVCHLQTLRGTDQIPPINGRSPTYTLRQLLAFRNGTRTNAQAAQMTPVVEKLELDDMIAIAAYLGQLSP
jgi:cytochrome c553